MSLHVFFTHCKTNKGFAWAMVLKSGHEKQFKEVGPSEKWCRGFKKWHPDLLSRNPISPDRGRISYIYHKNCLNIPDDTEFYHFTHPH